MKLLELVKYFRRGGLYESFCDKQSLDQESEVIEIYMKQPLDLNSDLDFFEIEKTEGAYEFINNKTNYTNLFDFYYFLDAIEDSNNESNKNLTDEDLAKILFEYAINDA